LVKECERALSKLKLLEVGGSHEELEAERCHGGISLSNLQLMSGETNLRHFQPKGTFIFSMGPLGMRK
jgi:hypothetical protein